MAKPKLKKKRVVRPVKKVKPRIPNNEEYMEGKFIGSTRKSKKIKHFHRLSCEWARYFNEKNSIIFDHHEEAVAAKYKPCKTCCS
jgi:methylphosphotriester-DNA--protein-cysteine methyltransferase